MNRTDNTAISPTEGINKQKISLNGGKLMENNTTRLAEQLLQEALRLRASDIHIEPLEKETRIRLRLDGRLQELGRIPLHRHAGLVSRFKIMGGMDIGEQRLPQDGRWQTHLQGQKLELRLSTLPGLYGEKLVIRVLDNTQQKLNLEQLGFSAANTRLYQRLYTQPNGLVLVTGPTGSGKSTTLYATLAQLNQGEVNITTLEDPVEYTLEGITQVAVNEKAGLTFNKGLRALVRQDPDIIMVGEIRDRITAELAVQAALTGHLVFSTLHTNSAVGSINRLLDMGIAPYLVASALRGVVSQRLVRRLCPHCRVKQPTRLLEQEIFRQHKYPLLPQEIYNSRGCSYCNGTGYKGRLAVQEVLMINEEMATLILEGSGEARKTQQARRQGTTSLAQDGLAKVLQGETTIEELLRAGVLEEVNHAI